MPPKSACWFCPFHQTARWTDMRRNRPALFDKACDLEDLLNAAATRSESSPQVTSSSSRSSEQCSTATAPGSRPASMFSA